MPATFLTVHLVASLCRTLRSTWRVSPQRSQRLRNRWRSLMTNAQAMPGLIRSVLSSCISMGSVSFEATRSYGPTADHWGLKPSWGKTRTSWRNPMKLWQSMLRKWRWTWRMEPRRVNAWLSCLVICNTNIVWVVYIMVFNHYLLEHATKTCQPFESIKIKRNIFEKWFCAIWLTSASPQDLSLVICIFVLYILSLTPLAQSHWAMTNASHDDDDTTQWLQELIEYNRQATSRVLVENASFIITPCATFCGMWPIMFHWIPWYIRHKVHLPCRPKLSHFQPMSF